MAADPTDFYHLPRDRVVELGRAGGYLTQTVGISDNPVTRLT